MENVIAHKGKVVDELIDIDRFHTFIDDIVILEDKFITDHPYQAGLFSQAIIDSATRMMINSETRTAFSVDQTAEAPVICNLVVPEEAKTATTIFNTSYQKILDEVMKNQSYRNLKIDTEAGEPNQISWVSYYEDRNRVFGLLMVDPKYPENAVSFLATKPDESDEALITFQIRLPGIKSVSDRYIMQMAFMSKALKFCEALGVKKFHYAEHFDLVDADDNVIGIIPRSVAHEDNRYIHRAASIMIWRRHFDEAKHAYVKQLFMTHRNKDRKMNASMWQAAPSGHLLPGETYTEAAHRQLREEVGAKLARKVTRIHPVIQLRAYSDSVDTNSPQKENFYFFVAHVDEDTSKFAETNYESDMSAWVDIDTIRKMLDENPSQFRDAFRMAFKAVDWDNISEKDLKRASA